MTLFFLKKKRGRATLATDMKTDMKHTLLLLLIVHVYIICCIKAHTLATKTQPVPGLISHDQDKLKEYSCYWLYAPSASSLQLATQSAPLYLPPESLSSPLLSFSLSCPLLQTAMVAAPPMPRNRSRGFWTRSSSSAGMAVEAREGLGQGRLRKIIKYLMMVAISNLRAQPKLLWRVSTTTKNIHARAFLKDERDSFCFLCRGSVLKQGNTEKEKELHMIHIPEITMTIVCTPVSISPLRIRSNRRFIPFTMALAALSAEFWTMRVCRW